MSYHDIAFLVGRLLLGGFFVMNGLNHFMKREMLSGYAGSKGVPSPGAVVVGTGVLLLGGGLSILVGSYTTLGIAALAVFLVPTTLKIHDFWAVEEEQKMQEMTNFMKNMALLGAVLTLLYVQQWPYAVGPLL